MFRAPAFDLTHAPLASFRWNSSEARELIAYSQKQGYTFFGFELGNEQNDNFKGADEAHDFLILQNLLEEVRGVKPPVQLLYRSLEHTITLLLLPPVALYQ